MGEFLSKGLVALFSALTFSVMAAEEAVEMYSDEMPGFKKILSQSILSLLEKENSLLVNRIFTCADNMQNFIFSPIKDCNEEKFFFIATQASATEGLELKKCSVMLNKVALLPNQWDCPRPLLGHLRQASVNLLSWQYVHFYLHTFPQVQTKRTHHIDGDRMELFNLIKKVGLTKSFFRIIVHKHEHTEDTYIAYNSLEELEEIESLKIFSKQSIQ